MKILAHVHKIIYNKYHKVRSPKPCLKAKQSQLYQPVLEYEMFQSLYHLQDEDD